VNAYRHFHSSGPAPYRCNWRGRRLNQTTAASTMPKQGDQCLAFPSPCLPPPRYALSVPLARSNSKSAIPPTFATTPFAYRSLAPRPTKQRSAYHPTSSILSFLIHSA
jgi:hypothetical protein